MPVYLKEIMYNYQREKRLYVMSEATSYLYCVFEDKLFDNLIHGKFQNDNNVSF